MRLKKMGLLASVFIIPAIGLFLSIPGELEASETEVSIPTYSPASYSSILDGTYTSSSATISGKLTIPSSVEGKPTPAVILLHGSGGIKDEIELSVAKALNDTGIATFVVDSFSGRGLSSTGSDQGKLTMASTIMDGFQALKALKSQPGIDPNRIGLAGFSRGGVGAIFVGQKKSLRRCFDRR